MHIYIALHNLYFVAKTGSPAPVFPEKNCLSFPGQQQCHIAIVRGCKEAEALTSNEQAKVCMMNFHTELIRFVQEEKEDKSWTSQKCLEYSIRLMNNLDIIASSSTLKTHLGLWNRTLAYNKQDIFCKSTINKVKSPPPVFEAKSDALNDFKQFGNEKIEFALASYDYVHEHLVPALVSNLGL